MDAGLSLNLTTALTGDSAAANVVLVGEISDKSKQMVVRQVFAQSMRNVFILCACMAGIAAFCSIMVSGKTLSQTHVETRTGLRDEKIEDVQMS